MASERMQCPSCGVEMNPHASKPAEPTSREEVARADPELGLLLDEVHTCPQCGGSASRPAPFA